MKVKTTRPTFVAGEAVKAGKTIDVSETDGRNLIAGGKAVPVGDSVGDAPEDRNIDGSDASTRS